MVLSEHLPFRVRQSWGIVALGNTWGNVVYAGKYFDFLVELLRKFRWRTKRLIKDARSDWLTASAEENP